MISRHVVTGFPEQRLAYLADKIKALDAHYCVILKPGAFGLLGVVRFSDVAANPGAGLRIFADLMQSKPSHAVLDTDAVEVVVDLLVQNPDLIAVEKSSGEFVGLITPDSFLRWLGSVAQTLPIAVHKIPPNSRWHPHSPPQGTGPAHFVAE